MTPRPRAKGRQAAVIGTNSDQVMPLLQPALPCLPLSTRIKARWLARASMPSQDPPAGSSCNHVSPTKGPRHQSPQFLNTQCSPSTACHTAQLQCPLLLEASVDTPGHLCRTPLLFPSLNTSHLIIIL